MNNLKYILSIILILFSSNLAYSNYYADININVINNGEITINGNTNFKEFQNIIRTQKYTSKDGEYWVLNISKNKIFENYSFKLTLPRGSEINYIKTTPNLKINENNNQIVIVGIGKNKPFTLIVQYKVNYLKSNLFKNSLFFSFLVLIFIILSLIILNSKNKKIIIKKNDTTNSNEIKKIEFDLSNFSKRQQEIIKLIQKNKKMTQKQLEYIMKIPKSSISRNVNSLVIKGILKKNKYGQSNYIEINLEIS